MTTLRRDPRAVLADRQPRWRGRPLLLWVDDLQWVDAPSRRFLAYLGRRLADLPVLLVVGVRPALPGEDRTPVDAIASRPRHAARAAGAAERRCGGHAGRGAGSGRRADPAFAEELPARDRRQRAAGGGASDGAGGRRGADADDPGLETTGIERVGRGVARRLELLPRAAIELAEAVAVLGDGSQLEAAAALAGLAPGEAAARRRGAGRGRHPRRRPDAALPSPAGARRRRRWALRRRARSRRTRGRRASSPSAARPRR